MEKLYDRLNQIAQELILLDEGDVIGLSNIYSKFEDDYSVIAQLGDSSITELVKQLLRLIDTQLKNEVNDFGKVVKHLSDGINFLLQTSYNYQNNVKETVLCEELIQEIKQLVPAGKEINLPDIELTPALAQEPSELKETKSTNLTEDVELYNNFIIETTEHIDAVEVNVLSLERDPTQHECVQSIFRAFHTIKGVSGFLNLNDIHFLAHETENLLDKVLHDHILMDDEYLDLILDNTDTMRKLVESVKAKLSGQELTPAPLDHSFITERIQAILNKDIQIIERRRIGEILIEHGEIEEEVIDKIVKKQDEDEDKNKRFGELLITEKAAAPRQIARALRTQKKSIVVKEMGADAKQKLQDMSIVRVNAQKLDNLLDMVGELVIANNQVSQNDEVKKIVDAKLHKDLNQLERVVFDLQKLSMSLRMIEIKQTFQKMNRLVRDLSKKSGKPIELILTGVDTEIDRRIVDELQEPLVHIIRNSVDHGIELPEERLEKNKSETGIIQLSAYHQGGSIIIEIEDDGKGLDRERILKKALEKGLIQDSKNISPQEIEELIFHHGFSTAKKVTDISGRGIGMDIVKKKIHQFRGMIDVSSEPEKGTKFSLKIPITMAIIDGMIVSIGRHKYVLPTIHVRQIFKLNKEKYFTLEQKGEMIDARGKLVPLIRLYKILKVEPKFVEPEDGLIVLVEMNGKQKCLLLDDIIDKQEVVVKALGDRLGEIEGIASGTILSDGKVGLILDIKGIFDLQEKFTENNQAVTI